MGISDRGTKAKSITSCDNAFVTNIGAADAALALRFRAKNICWPETLQRSEAAHRTPPRKLCSARKRSVSGKCFICAKAKRQQQMFSVAKAKRQLQSAQSERKSTTRYGEGPLKWKKCDSYTICIAVFLLSYTFFGKNVF
ncbi:hypothetical protein [Lysinibacillus xylanilyticus]|uniref:hypothetical protein n=1 Tax=Lysinibacillus xylanilyticus TaxID=582475 RepID=UPI003D032DBB